MLYEMALPALLVKSYARHLLTRQIGSAIAPALRLRADRGRLRRAELRLVGRVSPTLAAWIALRRLERIDPAHRTPIFCPAGGRLLRTGRGKVFARSLGDQNAPRVLLLHGWNADGRMMLPLAHHLEKAGFCVVVPDLASSALTAGRRLDVQCVARRLVAECDIYGPYEAVIGHSAGGLVGAVAKREGLRADRLVTISTTASVASLLTGYLTFTAAPETLKPAMLNLYKMQRGRDPARIGPEDFVRFCAAHLVIHAANDWQVSPQSAQRICAGRTGLSPVVLPGCNHQSVLRQAGLADLIVNFIANTAPAPGVSC